MSIELRGFLIGSLAGLVCIGGLGLGLLIFIKTYYNQTLKRFWARLRYLLSALLLIGQFFAALKILDVFEESKTASVSVACGLLVAIFASALLAAPYFLNGTRKK